MCVFALTVDVENMTEPLRESELEFDCGGNTAPPHQRQGCLGDGMRRVNPDRGVAFRREREEAARFLGGWKPLGNLFVGVNKMGEAAKRL